MRRVRGASLDTARRQPSAHLQHEVDVLLALLAWGPALRLLSRPLALPLLHVLRVLPMLALPATCRCDAGLSASRGPCCVSRP